MVLRNTFNRKIVILIVLNPQYNVVSRGKKKYGCTLYSSGETTFAYAAPLRRRIFKKQKCSFKRNVVSDRFPKTASKNIEKRRRSRLLRDVHISEIAN